MTLGQIIALAVIGAVALVSGVFLLWDIWRWYQEEKKLLEEKKRHDRRR